MAIPYIVTTNKAEEAKARQANTALTSEHA